jgi:hypothetical protein
MDTVKDLETYPLWVPGEQCIQKEPLVSVKEEVSFSFFLRLPLKLNSAFSFFLDCL